MDMVIGKFSKGKKAIRGVEDKGGFRKGVEDGGVKPDKEPIPVEVFQLGDESLCGFGKVRYDESYGKRMVGLMEEYGMGVVEACRCMGVGKGVVNRWMEEEEHFRGCIMEGENGARGWWERQGRENIHNPKFNTRLYTLFMANRFGYSTGTREVKGRVEHAHAHLLIGEKTETEKKQERLLHDRRRLAETLDILIEAGAFGRGAGGSAGAAIERIHTNRADREADGVSADGKP